MDTPEFERHVAARLKWEDEHPPAPPVPTYPSKTRAWVEDLWGLFVYVLAVTVLMGLFLWLCGFISVST